MDPPSPPPIAPIELSVASSHGAAIPVSKIPRPRPRPVQYNDDNKSVVDVNFAACVEPDDAGEELNGRVCSSERRRDIAGFYLCIFCHGRRMN